MKRKLIGLIIVFLAILNILVIDAIAVEEYKAKTYIDSPGEWEQPIVRGILTINGWYMTNDAEAQLKVYIDDEEQEIIELIREDRLDVLSAIKDYGDDEINSQPGYSAKIDISKIKAGLHTIKTNIVSRTGEVLATNVRKIDIQNYKGKIYVDTPETTNILTVGRTLTVDGWVMTDDIDAQIKVYIDGQEQIIQEIKRKERPDVINAIKGYGEIEKNPFPGFSLKVDLSNINDGKHEITIKVLSITNDILDTNTRFIDVQKYRTNTYIDSPQVEETVKPIMNISGWIMSTDKNANINIYLDDKKQKIESLIRKERPDVINAIKGYGGIEENPTPGYEAVINIGTITEGKHLLKIEIVSEDGIVIGQIERYINVEKYKAKTYIDEPLENEIKNIVKNFKIDGWIMTDDSNSKIKIYVDDKEVEYEIIRKSRQDVINAIKGYGGVEKNPTPGYSITVDLSEFNDGQHKIKIDVVSITGEIIDTRTRTVELNKYKAKSYLDLPKSMGKVRSTLIIEGWIMSTDVNHEIKVYINDQIQNSIVIKRKERPDVINAIKGYGEIEENPTPGFESQIDVSNLEDGKNTLRIDIISNEGKILHSESRVFVLYNNHGFGIDVSKHNGTINWSQVKQEGVDFAIIRAGNRGYGDSGNLVEDSKFVENMKGAISNGIKVGVYIYSQAITEAEAIEEADLAVRLIRDNGFSNNISLPIVIDTEASGGRADSLSSESRTAIVKAFCERIKQYGYTPMIYSNKWWLETKLDMNQLSSYELWLAHYKQTDDPVNNPSDYKGNHQIWQYTDSGKINGISTNVDLNISYKKYF